MDTQGDDFRTFLGDFMSTLPQEGFPAGFNLHAGAPGQF